MKYLLRPETSPVIAATLGIILVCGLGSPLGHAAAFSQSVVVLPGVQPYLLHASQGYLGVDIHDVDADRAKALKLPDAKGAEIVTIDHDAPAGKAGLKLHDVILQMNGQTVDSTEQLRRMLHEISAGKTVAFVISRDGQTMNISVQLGDKQAIEKAAWDNHIPVVAPDHPANAQQSFMPGANSGNGFLGGFTLGGGNTLHVGAVVDPVGSQLAAVLGVSDGTGLFVHSVDENSPAASAGLRAGDVILKVNQESVATRADWERLLRSNQGKQMQLTVVRDKKQQTLTLQANGSKKKGSLGTHPVPPDEGESLTAKLRDF